jgi:Protein of unknown function (DUF3604)
MQPGAPLQRVQIVKGWFRDGEVHEQVLDDFSTINAVLVPADSRKS